MPIYYVGIDVSKFKHTCCIIDENGTIIKSSFDFENSKDGFAIDLSDEEIYKMFKLYSIKFAHNPRCKNDIFSLLNGFLFFVNNT